MADQPSQAPFTSILAAAQNIAQAINALAQNYLNVQGAQSRAGITAKTLLKGSPGRVCAISVTVAGSASGSVIDATLTSATGPVAYVIPNAVTATPYVINIPCSYGIVVAPGSGMTLTVSYS